MNKYSTLLIVLLQDLTAKKSVKIKNKKRYAL